MYSNIFGKIEVSLTRVLAVMSAFIRHLSQACPRDRAPWKQTKSRGLRSTKSTTQRGKTFQVSRKPRGDSPAL